MRSRLNLLVLGVASLIVVSFVVPLGLMVRQQADQRGRLSAERYAQELTSVVVRVASTGIATTSEELSEVIGQVPTGSVIILPDGSQIGTADPDSALVGRVVAQRTALSSYNEQGFGLAIPVLTPEGTVVVYSSVGAETLTDGVAGAWVLLGVLGVGLIIAALVIADRLARTVVGPSRSIAAAAGRLGDGDLGTRVEEAGPPELVAIARAFNVLADRIRDLLAAEREAVADLSHRLRTPLTAVRLQVESLPETLERRALLDKVDGLGIAVNELISQARHPSAPEHGECDLIAVVRSRTGFWKVLAEEQDRQMLVELDRGPAMIGATADEAGAAIDALIGNVFSHTEPGVSFGIEARVDDEGVELEVSDLGPGFPEQVDPDRRGFSGADSSGLGLDIARRFADNAGGGMEFGTSPVGGARVVLRIPTSNGTVSANP
ncbi:MAG: HAMP domain-containing histidine kinase [Acidimicrobiia bacterium]|nr:HAMP domain-containing histidine kinase [Acidimicrobiia bacterium]